MHKSKEKIQKNVQKHTLCNFSCSSLNCVKFFVLFLNVFVSNFGRCTEFISARDEANDRTDGGRSRGEEAVFLSARIFSRYSASSELIALLEFSNFSRLLFVF